MKKALVLAVTAATCAVGSAYTISGTNAVNNDAGAVPIFTDNTGATAIPLSSGFAAVGTFSVVPDPLNTPADLNTNFTQFGTGIQVGFNGALDGLFNTPANASESIPLGNPGNDPRVGQNAYLVIGNGTSILDSTAFAVFRGGVIGTEDAVGLGGLDIPITGPINAGDLLIGTLIDAPSIPLPGGGTFEFRQGIGLQVIPVPEPSVSLLAGLAGLTLLIRRKR